MLVREELYERACRYFEGSNLIIRTDSVKLLGSPIGTEAFMESNIKSKFKSWSADLDLFSDIAKSQPQAVYAAFVHGVYSRWTYFFRSCYVPVDHLNCYEEKIRFIPALSGRSSINDLERDWLALLNCFDGMGLIYSTQYSNSQYQASLAITRPPVDCILNGEREPLYKVMVRQVE